MTEQLSLNALLQIAFVFASPFAAPSTSAQNNLPNGIADGQAFIIRPDGIGRLSDSLVTVQEARQKYPALQLTVEKGARGNPQLDERYYFVLREGREEFLIAECSCRPRADGSWEAERRADLPLSRVAFAAVSPKFSMVEGISIGSTVRDLRRAFPKTGKLVAVMQGFSEEAPFAAEYVCLGGNGFVNDLNDITNMHFYVKPAPTLKRVGTYSRAEYTSKIDDRAVIVAIQPGGGCLRNVTPD